MRPYRLVPGRRPAFPPVLAADEDGLVALGGEMDPDVLVEAYARGIFPWTGRPPIPWYSPDPRLVLCPADLHVSRRLARRLRQGRHEVRTDTCFGDLMRLCAGVPRPGQRGTWITPNMVRAYGALHERGVAHSVEVFRDGTLVGGVYGLALGAAFFGESMASLETDASKIALAHLCARLVERSFVLLDCQQVTRHLLSLGAVPLARAEFLRLLGRAVAEEDRW